MKHLKILLLLALLPFIGFGQGGPEGDAFFFRDKVTDIIMNGFTPDSGTFPLVWNFTQSKLFVWNGTAFVELGSDGYLQGVTSDGASLSFDVLGHGNPTISFSDFDLSAFNNDAVFLNQASLLALYPNLDIDNTDDFSNPATQNLNINGFTIENLNGLTVSGSVDSGQATIGTLQVNNSSIFTGASSFNSVFNPPYLALPPSIDIRPGSMYIDSDDGLVYVYNGSVWSALGSGSGDFLADGTIPLSGDLNLSNQNILNGGTGSFSLINTNIVAVGNGSGNARVRFQVSPGVYLDLEGGPNTLEYGGFDLVSPSSSNVLSQHSPINYSNATVGATLTGSLAGIDEVLGNIGKIVYTTSTANRTLLPGDIVSTAFPNRGRRVSIIVEDNSTLTIDDTLPIGVPFYLGSGDLADNLTVEFENSIVYGEGLDLVKSSESVNKIIIPSGRTIVLSKEKSGNYRADGRWEVFQSALDLPSLLVKQTPLTIDPSAVNEGDIVSVWNDSQSGFNATATTTSRGVLHIENGERQVLFDGVDDFYTYGSVPQLDFTPGTDEFTIVLKIGHAVSPTKTQQLISKAQLNSTASAQYSISLISNAQRYYVGGLQSVESPAFSPGDVIVMVVSTTEVDVYRNDIQIVDGAAVGAATTANDLLLGARFDGTSHNYEGSFSHIAIFNDAISRSEITEIYNEITQ